MKLDAIIRELDLKVLTKNRDFSQEEATHGYVSDMLSCVMTGAGQHAIWVTLQAHGNIVAVAQLLDLAAIIITENAQPDEKTIQKANDEGIALLSTKENSFNIVGNLWGLGLKDQ